MKKRDVILFILTFFIILVIFPKPIIADENQTAIDQTSIDKTISIVLQEKKLEISKIDELVAYSGDKKTLSFSIKNIGSVFLNFCKFSFSGDISNWIYSKDVFGIAPGEIKNFILNINIPEEIKEGDYFGKLDILCNELNESQDIKITVPKGLESIQIKDITQENNILKIKYIFETSASNSEDNSIDIWIANKDDKNIKKITDKFTTKRIGIIEREIFLSLPEGIYGLHYIYIAESYDHSKFVKQSIILGRNSVTGKVVIENSSQKFVGYIVFIIIILIGVGYSVFSKIKENKNTDSDSKQKLKKKNK